MSVLLIMLVFMISLIQILSKLWSWLIRNIDKLGLDIVMFLAASIGLLYFYNGNIMDDNNCIIYNGESNKFLTTILDMSLN